MRRTGHLSVGLVAALVVGASAPLREAQARERASLPLPDRLARVVASAGFKPGRLGLAIVSLDGGRTVYAKDADVALVPASTAKLATSAAALDLLGPGHVFTTTLAATAAPNADAGVVDGDLVLHGCGDPSLSKRDHPDDPLWPLSALAAAAAAKGVRRVSGALVLDDAGFDRRFLHPSWLASDLDDWYGAPVAGLTFNDSCVTVIVRGASSVGEAASVLVPSTSGAWPVDAAVSTSDVRQPSVGAIWTGERRRLRVAGEIPPRLESTFDTPVPDPLALVGAATIEALRRAGIRVDGGWRLAPPRAAGERDARLAELELGSVRNDLRTALRVMNKRSQNLYAETLFKGAGAEAYGTGSWESGERAVAAVLARRGIPTAGLRVVDGSGLSKENRLSAACLASLLASFDADPLRGPALRASLATPGEEGTLAKRFPKTPGRERIRAKTGTLGRSGVFALAGTVDGRPDAEGAARRGFAFAILMNGGPSKGDPRSFEEDVVRELLAE